MQKYVIALYIRLSLEDYKYDSMSIENQHLALNEFVSSMPESSNAEVLEFIDNGYSGTNFERPKVQELIEMVRTNKIDCIIVKDFSRFGRNSIETGYFIERVFPLFHTRFISINDDFDSDQHKGDTGGMDVAFKYLISEYYSRDACSFVLCGFGYIFDCNALSSIGLVILSAFGYLYIPYKLVMNHNSLTAIFSCALGFVNRYFIYQFTKQGGCQLFHFHKSAYRIYEILFILLHCANIAYSLPKVCNFGFQLHTLNLVLVRQLHKPFVCHLTRSVILV